MQSCMLRIPNAGMRNDASAPGWVTVAGGRPGTSVSKQRSLQPSLVKGLGQHRVKALAHIRRNLTHGTVPCEKPGWRVPKCKVSTCKSPRLGKGRGCSVSHSERTSKFVRPRAFLVATATKWLKLNAVLATPVP
jgi:hypothetical protein